MLRRHYPTLYLGAALHVAPALIPELRRRSPIRFTGPPI